MINKSMLILCVCAVGFGAAPGIKAAALTANHNACAAFDLIPLSVIEDIAIDYNIYYAHTSHGSQIMTGLDMVEAEDAAYAQPYCYERSDDLGHVGDTSWVPYTRTYLDATPACNMAMFSWCGGCSDNTVAGIQIYLDKMEELEADYPLVTFIYMTGHLDGSGVDGVLYRNNNQIRDYCASHGKILFDFADIESWDPDGTYYPDETDACYWCADWCSTHTCPTCGGCAHSHCFNCYQKGKAWWWMMAKISGWTSVPCCVPPTVGDIDQSGVVDISDISELVDNQFLTLTPLICEEEGDVDFSGTTDITDLSIVIDNQFLTLTPLPPCP